MAQWNNIKQKLLFIYYHLMKRKKLFGQPNIFWSIVKFKTFIFPLSEQ